MRKMILTIVMACAGMAQAETVVITAFGDSLTQGYGLPAEDGFVPQMQRWLDQQGAEVRLINAGVSGDTTAGGAARVDWTLTPDVDGMILALGGNDALRGLDPAAAHTNLAMIIETTQRADVATLLVGMQAGGNFGPQYKEAFDNIYPALAQDYDVVYAPSFFAGLMQNGTLPPIAVLLPDLQSDGLHPNAQGVAKIVQGLGPQVLALVQRIKN